MITNLPFPIFTASMQYLRWLLFPFSLLYGLVIIIRNWFYDAGLFKSREFDLPVICVGNLEVGGAGKSPMTEYLVRLLKNDRELATLSRGYGRKTKGFLTANATATATEIGDEPSQFYHKFPDVTVAVCEDRVAGINQLKINHNLILLDDAFQHRAVKPGLSILLFDYQHLQKPKMLLPAGNLREPFSSRWRADVMVITKCPTELSEEQMMRCYQQISPLNLQPLFFSAIAYQPLQDLQGNRINKLIDADATVFLLTGIANPKPLMQHISKYSAGIIHHNYPDHHQFSLKNIAKLADEFAACKSTKKIIITTEKDAQRLGVHELLPALAQLPVWVQPIGVQFLNNGQPAFDQLIKNYVREHPQHN
ncbi:tetraacyldisaccharide 4'-kinase [Mucilaginibacter phyllosphaerae]|uniref:Tetraacyldisaccharide 4'-kinase n=2 Tax=Mucilaginibacter phyllosphaerae TaxID=1812349 RepID=A0ABR6I3G5_9SPHI|nr:tetraacyldisaccharide 4'-kinase [Mucilaginibacter phyllosphaerae]MBB3967573.1 tetraacyldisaccharide 4'-kinase [Mucilaginibacter phyllosphaerae]